MNTHQTSAVEYRAWTLRNLMLLLGTAALLSTGFSACGGEEEELPNGRNGKAECITDADCTGGEEWCEDGFCEECDNSGLACDLMCEEGYEMVGRNGCLPCACVPVNECVNDDGCEDGVCIAGDQCLSWCPSGDPSCCYGNTCLGEVEGTCSTDADCTEGEEWCEEGLCEECDNSGLLCLLHCEEGYELDERNGCYPCECVPVNECMSDADCESGECVPGDMCLLWCPVDDPSCCYGNTCHVEIEGACSTDADCTEGEEWCEEGFCEECDNSGLVCDLACEEGFEMAARNGCYPCECVPVTECMSHEDCESGECVPGDMCFFWCEEGDPSCCYGNTCS